MTKYVVLDAESTSPTYGLADDAIVVDVPDDMSIDEVLQTANYEPTGRNFILHVHEVWKGEE